VNVPEVTQKNFRRRPYKFLYFNSWVTHPNLTKFLQNVQWLCSLNHYVSGIYASLLLSHFKVYWHFRVIFIDTPVSACIHVSINLLRQPNYTTLALPGVPHPSTRCGVKLAFHDADTDTDILARILVDTSDTRDFLKLFRWQAQRHADILATILARMSVSASWNANLIVSTQGFQGVIEVGLYDSSHYTPSVYTIFVYWKNWQTAI